VKADAGLSLLGKVLGAAGDPDVGAGTNALVATAHEGGETALPHELANVETIEHRSAEAVEYDNGALNLVLVDGLLEPISIAAANGAVHKNDVAVAVTGLGYGDDRLRRLGSCLRGSVRRRRKRRSQDSYGRQ